MFFYFWTNSSVPQSLLLPTPWPLAWHMEMILALGTMFTPQTTPSDNGASHPVLGASEMVPRQA